MGCRRSGVSAGDVARFSRALLGGRVLPQHLLHEMRHTVSLGPGVGYGLGRIRVASPCGPLWGHDGSFAGYLSDTLSAAGGRHQMVLAGCAEGGGPAHPDGGLRPPLMRPFGPVGGALHWPQRSCRRPSTG